MWIVTGGAGLIGSALLWELNRQGIQDILVVDRLGSTEKWKNLRHHRFSDYLEADDFLRRIETNKLPVVQGIVHLGACSSTTEINASYLIQNNFEYSKKLALWCAAKKKRFVYASSAATYGDGGAGYSIDLKNLHLLQPLNMYGYSKHLFDLWASCSGLFRQIVGVKFFNVFGPNEYHKGEMRSVVVKAFHQIQADGKVRLFKSYRPDYADGAQMRDFIYVKDAVRVVYEFMTDRKYNGLYNLGSGKARTWNDLVKSLFYAMEKPIQVDYIDMPEYLRTRYQYHTEADMGWYKPKKGREFLSLEAGVKDYVQNYLSQEDPYL